MNPPYSQWAGLASAFDPADQARLRNDIAKMGERLEHHGLGAYYSTQGLIQWFMALPAIMRPVRWGAVMPSIMASTVGALDMRIDLARRWHVETIVTAHIPGHPNMSEDTAINESIYVFALP